MMSKARKTVPTWDETFMAMAEVAGKRSKDPVTQVGACVVTQDRRILTIGYNGAPNGFDDHEFPWCKTETDPLENKYPYVVHAERNAILNFRGSLREFTDATIYVTLYPCNECAKEIIQVGIREVVYAFEPDWNRWEFTAAQRMFKTVGIRVRQLETHS